MLNRPPSDTSTPDSTTPIADAVFVQLQTLKPSHVELVNESMNHAGYFDGKESHFKLTIASADFVGKRLIARHQQVYGLLAELMTGQGGQIHALALHTYTPDEWQNQQQQQGQSPDSPKCAGRN